MELEGIIRLVFLLVIIIVLVILFVILGMSFKKEKKIPMEEEMAEEIETEVEIPKIIDTENCDEPLKEVISPFLKTPEPVDPSQSECMEVNQQDNIIHEMLDWGDDVYPEPSYDEHKFCKK